MADQTTREESVKRDDRPPLPPRRCRAYHGVPGCRCQVSGIAGKPHTGRHHCEEHDFSWSDDPTQTTGKPDRSAPRTEAGKALLNGAARSPVSGKSLAVVTPETIAAIEEQAATEALDSDDFRDRHERAIRAHILGDMPDGSRSPHAETHRCDDLCSAAIIDRLIGKQPTNEYPLQSHVTEAATGALDKYAEINGIGERAVALIKDLRDHGLQPGDADRLVIVALSQAATEARRELLAALRTAKEIIDTNMSEDSCRHGNDVYECDEAEGCADRSRRELIDSFFPGPSDAV